MQMWKVHNLYNLVLPMSVWKDTRTDKTMVIWFCSFALFWNNVRMKHWILPAANQYFPEVSWNWQKAHQNLYLILKCQLLSLSPFSSIISLIISLPKIISYHVIIDKKGVPHILFFPTRQLFNLIFRTTELLIHFTEVSELLVSLSQFMVLWATDRVHMLGKFKT